jgi:hypothetical protein
MIFARADNVKNAPSVWDELDAVPEKVPRARFRIKMTRLELLGVAAIIATLAALLVPCVFSSGRDWDTSHHFSPAKANAGEEFASLAGSYRQGNHLGYRLALEILPDGRYSFVWSGCCGVCDRESGNLKKSGEYLLLSPAKAMETGIPRILLPVPWGKRTYLVPDGKLQEFCGAVCVGKEPTHESKSRRYWVRGVQETVDGMPTLPPRWAAYLEDLVAIGRIVAIKSDRRAEIDVGSAEGIELAGIAMIQRRRRRQGNELTVLSVKEHACDVGTRVGETLEMPLEKGLKVVVARKRRPGENAR